MGTKLRKGWNPKQSAYVFAARSVEDAKNVVAKFGHNGHWKRIRKVTKYKSVKPTIQKGETYYLYRIDISRNPETWILYYDHGRFIKTYRRTKEEAEKHVAWLKKGGCTDVKILKREPSSGIPVSP